MNKWWQNLSSQQKLFLGGGLVALLIAAGAFIFLNSEEELEVAGGVNSLAVSQRPYVSLVPLQERNELEFIIHDLKLEADSVEVILEYSRNEGILDAILRQFDLTAGVPFSETMFLGTQSAGGSKTFHEDISGGKLLLTFSGPQEYTLEVPWWYSDTQTEYSRFVTTEGEFEIVFDEAYQTDNLLVMLSPGLPENVDGNVVAGPFLVRGVGPLPETEAEVTISLPGNVSGLTLLVYDGDTWTEYESEVSGGQLKAKTPVGQAYLVVER